MLIFAKRLTKLRKEKGLSQSELAERIEVSQAMISNWENNAFDISATNLKKLAQFFQTSSDFLIGLKEEEI